MNVGDVVRIVEDEHQELVGLEVTVTQLSKDGTAAWVVSASGYGVWCSVAALVATSS